MHDQFTDLAHRAAAAAGAANIVRVLSDEQRCCRYRKGESAANHDRQVDDVVAHCKSRMASYKKPKDVRIVESFPLNSTGKIAKKVLREELNAEVSS